MKKTISIVLAVSLAMTVNVANADFTFGTPTNLGPPISTPYGEVAPCITADGLEMYLNYYERPGGNSGYDIWKSMRETVTDDWGTPVKLGSPVNTEQYDVCMYISADGLELYLCSYNRSGGYGNWDIWMTTRATKDDAWGIPENLGPVVNSSAKDLCLTISSDGLELYFGSKRSGGFGSDDIWVSRRATKNDPWEQPTNLGPVVNSPASESAPFLSSNGLLLFFAEDKNSPIRPGGFGNQDTWVTRRASISDPWGAPVNLGPIVNSPSLDGVPQISPDGSALYFSSERPGGLGGNWWGDIYQAPIIPIVDFTGDYQVDIADLLILIEHWGQNEPSVDMAPSPFGDGTVDRADLEALMVHWGQELYDPHFIALWKLDETEGMFAAETVSGNDGIVFGNPLWQPEEGQVNGALEFDGIDDMVIAKPVLNPEDGPFSVFAWVKGGAPGQVIVSQQGGVNWLQIDVNGTIMTEFKSTGRTATPLYSETVITDDTWHRLGFVWDGSQRILYVDDIPVALDHQSGLDGSTGGLVIGAGSGNQTDTFWSGLIDDVRVYDRVVEP
jgi:hypothetical protein